jgi:hypothetical protein
VPLVTIKTDVTESGKEENISEYVCDCAGCPYPAEQVIGFSRELGGGFAVCAAHAAAMTGRRAQSSSRR